MSLSAHGYLCVSLSLRNFVEHLGCSCCAPTFHLLQLSESQKNVSSSGSPPCHLIVGADYLHHLQLPSSFPYRNCPKQGSMHRLNPLHRFSASSVACTYRTLRHNHHDLDAAGPLASRLSSRSVICFSGPDTVKFLQGLLTNDVRKFDEPPLDTEKSANMMTPNVSFAGASPLYAALLTPQGRFLYDFFLYKAPMVEEKLNRTGSGPGSNAAGEFQLFADVDSEFLDEIIQTFNRYRLRSKVEINSVAEEFSCWQRYGGKLSNKASAPEEPDASSIGWGGGTDVVAMSSTQGTDQGWRWFKDPRIDLLGYRGIFPSNSEPPLVDADKKTDEGNYVLWRLVNGVAEGSLEMPKGEAIPLEYNLEGLNAISFDKGCYVGQELVARTHHRGVIRKRLLPLKFVDDGGKEVNTKVAPGSEVIDGRSGKKVGAVTAAVACRGLGLLRLEDAFKGSPKLAIKGQDGVKVEATRPDWWPTEWAQEHQQDTAYGLRGNPA